MKPKRMIGAGIAVLLTAMPAIAHHSGAMFDAEKMVTLSGTVKEFQWTNPHCWIQVLVPAASGTAEWSVEMASPLEVYRAGWKRDTIKSGDKIVVTIHPVRDGSRGGLLVSVASINGVTPRVSS